MAEAVSPRGRKEDIIKPERDKEKLINRKINLFVPGRLCLFGEHSDWAGSYMICFVCGAELSPSVPLAMDQIESRTPEANDKTDQAEQDQSVPDDTMEIMRVFGKGHREIVHAEYKDDSNDI